MRRNCWLCGAILFLCAVFPCYGAGETHSYKITLTAAECDYIDFPVSLKIPSSQGHPVLYEGENREEVLCQLIREGAETPVIWMVDRLAKGAKRQYRLEFRSSAPKKQAQGVEVRQQGDEAEILIDGQLFTRYVTQETPRPFCYPIIGPTGKGMTRNYPMRKVEGESTDHVHHRSFWFTFGAVNGQDFWADGKDAGKIVHRDFEVLESGSVMGRIRARNDWIARDGKKTCEDTRELRVYRTPDGRLMDFAITLHASDGPVVLGDTKEGMMAFRVASSMEVTRGQGHIENAAGVKDQAAWGKRAAWCDYWGPVEGEVVGIAILDHPENLRHPTWWHVRDYGLFAANPFGLKDFGEKEEGQYTIPAGKSLIFRYRIYLHKGTTEQAQIGDMWEQYIRAPEVKVEE